MRGFLFGAARSSLLVPDAKNKNDCERSERAFIGLSPPAAGEGDHEIILPSPPLPAKVLTKAGFLCNNVTFGLSPPTAGVRDHEIIPLFSAN